MCSAQGKDGKRSCHVGKSASRINNGGEMLARQTFLKSVTIILVQKLPYSVNVVLKYGATGAQLAVVFWRSGRLDIQHVGLSMCMCDGLEMEAQLKLFRRLMQEGR